MMPDARRSRRPHIKSRSGCQNCRQRRVKCGEERPSCRNCTRRGEDCNLPDIALVRGAPSTRSVVLSPEPRQQIPLPRGPSSSNGGIGIGNLTLLDLELLHHYTTSTYLTLSSDPVHRHWFLVSVPQLGFSHPYVLHSVLALASSHLAHFRPESRKYYHDEATARHTIATSIAAPLLSDMASANLIPMYCFSILTMFISFANLSEDDDFFDANNGMPTWLTLFRGVRIVLESNDRAVISSSIAFLFNPRHSVNDSWDSRQLEHDALKQFQEHLDTSTSTSQHEHTRQYLLTAFRDLRSAFSFFYGEELWNEGKTRAIFTWLYKIPDEYVDMLQRENTHALCILGFFCVLLHRLEYNWWLKGWGIHLIERIYATLDDVNRFWISWPIQEIGWIPRRS